MSFELRVFMHDDNNKLTLLEQIELEPGKLKEAVESVPHGFILKVVEVKGVTNRIIRDDLPMTAQAKEYYKKRVL